MRLSSSPRRINVKGTTMKIIKSASGEASKGAAEPTTAPTQPATAAPPENANQADFTYVGDPNAVFDLNSYYKEVGVEANTTIKEPGAVKVPDNMTTAMPKGDK